ncbi:MAG: NYN domain-containing protein [Candidatus Ratteibacteria bacterium]
MKPIILGFDMEYILDGYNVIRSSWLKKKGNTFTDSGRGALCILLGEYRRKHPSVRFIVVFDGMGDRSSQGKGVQVLYSLDKTADDYILALLARKKRSSCTVISDDRQIRYGAHLLGYPVLKVEEFLSIIAPATGPSAEVVKKNEVSAGIRNKIEQELLQYYEKRESPSSWIRRSSRTRESIQEELRSRRQGA